MLQRGPSGKFIATASENKGCGFLGLRGITITIKSKNLRYANWFRETALSFFQVAATWELSCDLGTGYPNRMSLDEAKYLSQGMQLGVRCGESYFSLEPSTLVLRTSQDLDGVPFVFLRVQFPYHSCPPKKVVEVSCRRTEANRSEAFAAIGSDIAAKPKCQTLSDIFKANQPSPRPNAASQSSPTLTTISNTRTDSVRFRTQ